MALSKRAGNRQMLRDLADWEPYLRAEAKKNRLARREAAWVEACWPRLPGLAPGAPPRSRGLQPAT